MSFLRRRHQDPPSQVDANIEERLLSGELGAADRPSELSAVAAAIGAARGPARPDELLGEAELVAAMAAIARRRTPTSPAGHPSWSLRKKSAVVVVAAFASFGTAGVAAAARGSLPGPTQDFVSHAASHFDITFPTVAHPKDTPSKHPVTPTTTRSPVTGTSSSTAASTTTTTKPSTGTTTTGASTTSGPSTSLQVHPEPGLLPTVTQPPTTKPATTPPPTTQPPTTTTSSKKAATAIKAPTIATTAATDGAATKGKGGDHKNPNAGNEMKPEKDKKS